LKKKTPGEAEGTRSQSESSKKKFWKRRFRGKDTINEFEWITRGDKISCLLKANKKGRAKLEF